MAVWSRASLSVLLGVTVGLLLRSSSDRKRQIETREGQLSEMYTKMLASLAHTVEARDPHTRGHCERVAENAVVMGRALGFGGDQLEDLYWGALLHDLGKIAVPETVLLKKGPLTSAEYAIVKKHPAYGADLLASLSQRYTAISAAVRAHHERYDGTGYPQGLTGETIPLVSRIISIADVYEALTSPRPYREPMTCEDALRYIAKGSGGQFDPALVPIFERCYARGEISCSNPSSSYPVVLEARPKFLPATL